MRTFQTGATRNSVAGKPQYSKYLSPRMVRAFGEYMLKHQTQADGTIRAGDNWQKGIPMDDYVDSGWRHFFEWWELHRASLDEALSPEQEEQLEEALSALWFNVQGYMHEHLKRKQGSDAWLLKQAIQAQNAGARERREMLSAVVEGVDSVNDSYTPDLRPREEGAWVEPEPDPIQRGFAWYRHLEGDSPAAEPEPTPRGGWWSGL